MRRNVVFDKGRGWRGDDRQFHRMHIREDRGADVGEYRPQETSELSDAGPISNRIVAGARKVTHAAMND